LLLKRKTFSSFFVTYGTESRSLRVSVFKHDSVYEF